MRTIFLLPCCIFRDCYVFGVKERLGSVGNLLFLGSVGNLLFLELVVKKKNIYFGAR